MRNPTLKLHRARPLRLAAGAVMGLALIGPARPAAAGIDPLSGIDFVRITHPGNAPWMGNGTPGDQAIGRGGVNYEYSIGRFEVTTSEWVEFVNAALDRPADDPIPNVIAPGFWGATPTTPNTPGGRRFRVPAGNEMRPVGNISWRMAAMYCNWLCNGKATDRSAFMNGAYDANTFTYNPDDSFNDQLTHNAGAQYWIPTWDEWLKAAHYDPDKNGPDQGGWWVYSNGTDNPLVGGPPGAGDANFGWRSGGAQFEVPLGAYPQTRSPWGLLDAAGATAEWTEATVSLSLEPGDTRMAERVTGGSWWGSSPGTGIADSIVVKGSEFPSITILNYGLRIASAVPSPSACWVVFGCVAWMTTRTRRRDQHGTLHSGCRNT